MIVVTVKTDIVAVLGVLIGHGRIVSNVVLVLHYICHALRRESVFHKTDELGVLHCSRLAMKHVASSIENEYSGRS